MNHLSPDVTSVLARDVYDIRVSEDLSGLGAAVPEWREAFNPPQRVTESSGALLRSSTGFGFVSTGRGNRAREALVVMRGTASLADGVTDGSCGMQLGPGGQIVHAGFNETFKSVKDQLDTCLNDSQNQGINHIHCVGHSLGGALATLVADYARSRGMSVSLYTFGSPRVGLFPFSRDITDVIGAESIFRVYHTNDPVSMVPLFPFVHAPANGPVIMLPSNQSAYDAGLAIGAGRSVERQNRDNAWAYPECVSLGHRPRRGGYPRYYGGGSQVYPQLPAYRNRDPSLQGDFARSSAKERGKGSVPNGAKLRARLKITRILAVCLKGVSS